MLFAMRKSLEKCVDDLRKGLRSESGKSLLAFMVKEKREKSDGIFQLLLPLGAVFLHSDQKFYSSFLPVLSQSFSRSTHREGKN
jgi:hypothetical protein